MDAQIRGVVIAMEPTIPPICKNRESLMKLTPTTTLCCPRSEMESEVRGQILSVNVSINGIKLKLIIIYDFKPTSPKLVYD